jgi:glycosyltransferase involved in cell wall biosynthesis
MVTCDYLPNPGGISGHVYELSKALAKQGHEINIFGGHSLEHSNKTNSSLPANVKIIQNIAFRYNIFGYIKYHLLILWSLKQHLRKEEYDIIHWHNLVWESFTIKLLNTEIPRVFSNHSSGFLRRCKVLWRRKYQLPFLLKAANAIITPSEILKKQTMKVGFPQERIYFIPNGVDSESFSRKALGKYPDVSDESIVLVVSARLHKIKGIDLLLDAIPLVLREGHLIEVIILGEGDEKSSLIMQATNLGIQDKVHFVGCFSRDEMPKMLSYGDWAVLPSRAEAISLSGLEAMSCGLPVIGFSVGGIPQFVKEGLTGFLAEPENPQDLARAICKALELVPNDVYKMRSYVSRYVEEHFSWKNSAISVQEVYKVVIESRQNK